jgi:DMSO/TMAO reductase YedYZ molybdopterin-dependent catalytic subunit
MASAGQAAQVASAQELVVKPTPPELFFDYGSNKEMRWQNMSQRGYVVPNELFFVRNHTRTPRIDLATWRLKVEGSGVRRPLELSYEALRSLPSVSVIRTIECAGNGRVLRAPTPRRPRGRNGSWVLLVSPSGPVCVCAMF